MAHQNSESFHNRESAWQLLQAWTASPSLIRHGLAVETCTQAYGAREA
jgi:predicted hydrolase (HD superfamily)